MPLRMVNVLELRDPVSSASHLATALWAVFATLLMVRLASPGRRVPLVVYGLSMVFLYLASGTFHGLHFGSYDEKRFYQKLDQSAVYCLIAGTYTPILAILLTGGMRRWLLRLVWGFAAAGVACQWVFPKPPHAAVVGLYLGLGWSGLPAVGRFYRAVGWRAMNWAALGAALYTAGAVFELCQWPVIVPGWVQAHEVLHVCDTAATLAFFVFVVRHVVPYRGEGLRSQGSRPGLPSAAPAGAQSLRMV